jgi:hypothetical protein
MLNRGIMKAQYPMLGRGCAILKLSHSSGMMTTDDDN